MGSLIEGARALVPFMTDVRRRLHRRPECGLQLPHTQATVFDELERLGLSPVAGRTVSSVTAVIDGVRSGPTILLRADMDALPVAEATGLEFVSETGNTMHACGHDMHIAMLLGAARLLVTRRRMLAGRVLLMFQPGEEGMHGARHMLDEGLLDVASRPEGAFALHVSTAYSSGDIALRPGAMLAASDTIRITVRGRGGHASAPHLAGDPIAVAAQIVLALQLAVTRQVDVFDPAVVTIATIAGGTTSNIIPETVHLAGTIRTVSPLRRQQVGGLVVQVAENIARANGLAAEVVIEAGYPVTYNDPAFTAFASEVARDLLGDRVFDMPTPNMGAEDFSYVLERIPGAIAFLGARPVGLDLEGAPQIHSNVVIFDEAPMADGAALHAGIALERLRDQ